MAGTALPGRLSWREAEVVATRAETSRVRTLVLDVPGWHGHRPGQRVDVRLTAPDGYQARRSYSIASAPAERPELTVERIEDGEVSPFLVDELQVGDRFELLGPIGGFVWEPSDPGPVLLVAGGSGIVPLMSMLRAHHAAGSTVPMRLLYSSRSVDDIVFLSELKQLEHGGVEIVHTLTRVWPSAWTGRTGRFDRQSLEQLGWPAQAQPGAYVCGPSGFVEVVAGSLVEVGYEQARVRTERFGPSAG